ncbi:uncharacterized protein D806_0078-like [Ailuropoda melanoleuca]|uniref:uncharacterized protein D806_0078-like n=1 Tax=Ailuropoda melanoleuca TaxID=9646 RepID=UPI0014941785|nr:uncharacterized protein D806_0078-like [Ailuropoda melanoleuca]
MPAPWAPRLGTSPVPHASGPELNGGDTPPPPPGAPKTRTHTRAPRARHAPSRALDRKNPALPRTGPRQTWPAPRVGVGTGCAAGSRRVGSPPLHHNTFGVYSPLKLGVPGVSQAWICPETGGSRRVLLALSRRPMALHPSAARRLPPELPALHPHPAEDSAEPAARTACASGGDGGGGGGAGSRVCQLPRGRGHSLPPPPLAPASRPPPLQIPPLGNFDSFSFFALGESPSPPVVSSALVPGDWR